MTYVSGFVYCESVEQPDPLAPLSEQKFRINQPFSALNLRFMPTQFSFSVLVTFGEIRAHAENQLKLTLKFNEDILLDTGEIQLPTPQDIVDNVFDAYMVFDIKNQAFEEEGKLTTEVFFNDEIIHVADIRVVKMRINDVEEVK